MQSYSTSEVETPRWKRRGGNAIRSIKVFLLVGLIVITTLLIFLYLAGVSEIWITTKGAENKVIRTWTEFPKYPDAKVIEQRISLYGGDTWEEFNCVGASLKTLYGSQAGFKEILAFYQSELLKSGWADVSDEYVTPVFLKKSFATSITSTDLSSYLDKVKNYRQISSQSGLNISAIKYRTNHYKTLYLIGLSFDTPSCPNG